MEPAVADEWAKVSRELDRIAVDLEVVAARLIEPQPQVSLVVIAERLRQISERRR